MTDSDRDVIYKVHHNRLTKTLVMIHDEDNYSEDQVAPDRVGPAAAEGGASVIGGLGVGMGAVDFRLPPHTKPPAQHTTLGSRGTSVPGATNEAGNLAQLESGTRSTSGNLKASAEKGKISRQDLCGQVAWSHKSTIL